MLMVDRVELGLLDELQHMRKLEADDAVRLEQYGKPGHKIIDVGNMGKHVVSDNKIGFASFARATARP